MSQVLCDQLSVMALGGSANAGIGGATLYPPYTEVAGALRVKRFTYTIPASGPGSVAGDVIVIAVLNVLDRFYAGRIIVGGAAGIGAGTTLQMGKIDTNNPANTDPIHYLGAVPTAGGAIYDADSNLTEQVGAQPSGAASDVGDAPNPQAAGGGYGNGPILVTLTIGGTPVATDQIQGFITYGGMA